MGCGMRGSPRRLKKRRWLYDRGVMFSTAASEAGVMDYGQGIMSFLHLLASLGFGWVYLVIDHIGCGGVGRLDRWLDWKVVMT